MSKSIVGVGAILMGLLVSACGDDGVPAAVCRPGESVACTGAGGCTGGQACLPDGTGFDPCVCAADSGQLDSTMDSGPGDTGAPDSGGGTDAGADAARDGGPDASPDASPDADVPTGDAGIDAGPLCGCAPGEYCNPTGACASGPAPAGGHCGPTSTCNASSGAFPGCLDTMCASNSCARAEVGVLPLRDICTRPCVITVDAVGPGGVAGGDGVEDPGAPSDCAPAGVYDGPAGTSYRCVSFSGPGSGSASSYCLPGTTFAQCTSNADCPTGEVCDLSTITADLRLRCGAPYRENIGWPGAVVRLGTACNEDALAGPLAYCSDGPCNGGYCSAFCASDADCDTSPFNATERCTAGACENDSGRSCTDDADCSSATCSFPYDLTSVGGPSLMLCGPRS